MYMYMCTHLFPEPTLIVPSFKQLVSFIENQPLHTTHTHTHARAQLSTYYMYMHVYMYIR